MTKALKKHLTAALLLLLSLSLVACSHQTSKQSASSKSSSTTVSQSSRSSSSTVPATSQSYQSETVTSSSQTTQPSSETETSSTTASQTSPTYTDSISVGTYTFKNTVPVKPSPQEAAETEFYFGPGDSVNYAQRFTNDNHIWIAYPDYSGQTHYAMIE